MRISDWSSDVCSSDLDTPLFCRPIPLLPAIFKGASMPPFRRIALALAAPTALVAAGPALAKPKAEQAAPIAELVKAVDIPYQSFTLDNGLRVIVHEDRKAPVVAGSVWHRVGSKNEPAGKTRFATLLEPLMFHGSENAPGDFLAPPEQFGPHNHHATTHQ